MTSLNSVTVTAGSQYPVMSMRLQLAVCWERVEKAKPLRIVTVARRLYWGRGIAVRWLWWVSSLGHGFGVLMSLYCTVTDWPVARHESPASLPQSAIHESQCNAELITILHFTPRPTAWFVKGEPPQSVNIIDSSQGHKHNKACPELICRLLMEIHTNGPLLLIQPQEMRNSEAVPLRSAAAAALWPATWIIALSPAPFVLKSPNIFVVFIHKLLWDVERRGIWRP